VFVDPPYAAWLITQVLEALASGSLLASGAVIIVEHDKHHVPPETVSGLHQTDQRFYGDTGVSFYRHETGLS
jgi:16S rRNA G966 N2-methylase RsmD